MATPIPANGGFDANGHAYSANLLGQIRESNGLGALQSWRGNIFVFGPPNALNGVASTTISLPHGSYSQILMLAATAYGPIANATFVVTYSDASTTSATYTMSDWCDAQFYTGETVVSQQVYRDAAPSGTQDALATQTYGYSINLDSSKTLSTLKLPTTRDVVILGLDLKQ